MKPILFSTHMVQAILEGTKTQTRRVLKPQPLVHNEVIKMPIPLDEYTKILNQYVKKGYTQVYTKGVLQGMIAPKCPFGEVGDTIWVRETFAPIINTEGQETFVYKADDDFYKDTIEDWKGWKPSLFMPKDACRLFLKITNIRVERLQDISEVDAIAEGIKCVNHYKTNKPFYSDYTYYSNDSLSDCGGFYDPKDSFKSLWQSINGKESLNANPFVWVIEFETIKNQ